MQGLSTKNLKYLETQIKMADLLADRINYENERYYNMRQIRMGIFMSLETAKNLEKELLNKVREEKEEENCCSICMESLDNKNIVNTKCKHKFCLSCIINNHNYNKHTGKLCSICRTELL